MCRARLRSFKDISKTEIEEILDVELRKIAYMYYIQHISQLDIAFELGYCEDTIYSRIKEIKGIILKNQTKGV